MTMQASQAHDEGSIPFTRSNPKIEFLQQAAALTGREDEQGCV